MATFRQWLLNIEGPEIFVCVNNESTKIVVCVNNESTTGAEIPRWICQS